MTMLMQASARTPINAPSVLSPERHLSTKIRFIGCPRCFKKPETAQQGHLVKRTVLKGVCAVARDSTGKLTCKDYIFSQFGLISRL